MFKDEFETLDPTKLPFESAEEAREAASTDIYGDGLDPSQRRVKLFPDPVPILQVQDSAKFANAS